MGVGCRGGRRRDDAVRGFFVHGHGGDVAGQGDHAYPAFAHGGLHGPAQHMRHLGRRGNKFVAVAAFVEQLIGVRFLKIARPDGGAGDMRGYGDDRGIAPVGVVQAVDEVDVPWAARPRAGREFFGKLGFGSGGEGGRFLMPHMDEPDAPVTPVLPGAPAVPGTPAEPELSFGDVSEGAWYYDAALWAYREGLMAGTTKTTFSPDVATTRGMVVTILWRQAGAPAVDYTIDFTDVASDAYYAEAVRWAVSQGVAAGYGNGLFGPDDPITREQFAAILYRCAGSPAIPERVLDFIDAEQISPYAEDTLRWAVSEGLISGKGGGILDPQGEATRAQTAAMLMRYYQ